MVTPEQYEAMAERNGLRVCRIHTEAKAWDFKSRSAFFAFGSVTFVEWTRFFTVGKPVFVIDVLDRFRVCGGRYARRGEYLQVLSDGHHACALAKKWR